MDLGRDVVMGHEVSGEIVELGAGVGGWRTGEVVTALPTIVDGRGIHQLGFSNEYPGGYGEYVVVDGERTLRAFELNWRRMLEQREGIVPRVLRHLAELVKDPALLTLPHVRIARRQRPD